MRGMTYSVSRIDARNVAHVIATGLSLEVSNRVREFFSTRLPDDDFVVQPVNSPAPVPDAPPESNWTVPKKNAADCQSQQSAASEFPRLP